MLWKGTFDHVFVVLTGRPMTFCATPFDSDTMSYKDLRDDSEHALHITEDARETDYEHEYFSDEDAQLLLLSNLAKLEIWIKQTFADPTLTSKITLVNGGIAAKAGVSYKIHFLEDQCSKIEIKNEKSKPILKILSVGEYKAVARETYRMSPFERRKFRQAQCQHAVDAAGVTKKTYSTIMSIEARLCSFKNLTVYIGGPCTALQHLFSSHDSPIMNGPSLTIMAMMCSLRRDSTLLGENFNIKTDLGAFQTVFKSFESFNDSHKPDVFIVPTDVCKYNKWLCMTSDQVATLGLGELFCAYHALWNTIKGQPQPMFDALITVPPTEIPFRMVPVTLSYSRLDSDSDHHDIRCDLKQVDVDAPDHRSTPFKAFIPEPTCDSLDTEHARQLFSRVNNTM